MATPKIPRGKAESKRSKGDQEPTEEESAEVSTPSSRRRTKTASPPKKKAESPPTAKTRPKTGTKPRRANSRDSARATPPHPRRAVLQPPGRNRLLRTLDHVSLSNKSALNALISKIPHTSVELAPAFQEICHRNRSMGVRLAEAYAESISDPLQHRELFQQAAAMTSVERKILISGYKRAGQARGVVHAI